MSLPTATLPRTFWEALLRGLRFRCPRCGGSGLFRNRPLPPQQADDFPAYLSIFVTGHLLAPVIIMLALDYALSTLQMMAIILPTATIMIIAMLQPAKGAVIAAQWWNGMHGFLRERADEEPAKVQL
jgi:uncharacterized protein (DUF983 family)